MQLFLDMDGVLADFDAHHEAVFGRRPDKLKDDVDWKAIRAVKGFYSDIPPMPDLEVLWGATAHLRPIVLTGVPSSVEEAPANKTAWVRKHLGPNVEVRCVLSREKSKHCRPGDVLIDDWEKYRHLWVGAGGFWITHRSAPESVLALTEYLEAIAREIAPGQPAPAQRR